MFVHNIEITFQNSSVAFDIIGRHYIVENSLVGKFQDEFKCLRFYPIKNCLVVFSGNSFELRQSGILGDAGGFSLEKDKRVYIVKEIHDSASNSMRLVTVEINQDIFI